VDLHAKAWQDALSDHGHEIGFDEIRRQIGKDGDQLMPVFLSEAELAHFIQGMAGIWRRVSRKLLIVFTDWVSKPACPRNHTEPHPPCPTIRPRHSCFQP